MKVEIEKYKAKKTEIVSFQDLKDWSYVSGVSEGYTYYIFRTEEKAWIRHSGKLTKQEKQWVIEHESK